MNYHLFLSHYYNLELNQNINNHFLNYNNINCNFLEINEHKFDVQLKRYFYYLKILEKKEYKNTYGTCKGGLLPPSTL